MKLRSLILSACLIAFPSGAFAESSALILMGPGGDAAHTKKFQKWSDDTRKVLVERFGFLQNRVHVLAEKDTVQAKVKETFAAIKTEIKATDSFFLFFIGHGDPWEIPGTAAPVDLLQFADQQAVTGGGGGGRGQAPRGGGAPGGGGRGGGAGRGGRGGGGGPQGPQGLMDYKFNISGPDMTATEFGEMIASLSAARVVVINMTNSSGASLERMAGRNRIIVTATRSASEVNDTVFYDHFLTGLQDAAADEDKDKKVSIWEAFKFASDSVERYYKDQGRLATEHPMISDNGLEAVASSSKDLPILARYTVFNVDRPLTVSDPKLQALLDQRREIELAIEGLRLDERNRVPEEFDKRMEELIIQLARKTDEIRKQEKR